MAIRIWPSYEPRRSPQAAEVVALHCLGHWKLWYGTVRYSSILNLSMRLEEVFKILKHRHAIYSAAHWYHGTPVILRNILKL
jgi:hypothetical protein